jgi:hypothetical protein
MGKVNTGMVLVNGIADIWLVFSAHGRCLKILSLMGVFMTSNHVSTS